MPPSSAPQEVSSRPDGARRKLASAWRTTAFHLKNHVGVGIICSVAYFDPGNWSVDLDAGSNYGYRPMLFVVLMAGLGAIVLQCLACKLGCVTGIDLASHCRLLLHDHPRHPKLVRRAVLYPLYVVSEIAIISTDLAELLGSAIGFCLIFPKLPLWAGVLLTALDVLVFLAFADPTQGQGKPARLFEIIIVALVFAVFCCFLVLLVQVKPHWGMVFLGYIPSMDLVQSSNGVMYSAVGILGATIMPHALFLGSCLATQDRSAFSEQQPLPVTTLRQDLRQRVKEYVWSLFRISRADRELSSADYRSKHEFRENKELTFIRKHLPHALVDVVTSLLGVAVPINSAILVIAATVFHNHDTRGEMPAGLFEAHDIIKQTVGSGAAFIFALALVCAGQTSSITATLAGQIVSEGFIEWRISPFMRRLVTRCLSLVPSVTVAVIVGRSGLTSLLFVSQVILSIVLPFIAFPLIYLTSSNVVMRVRAHPKNSQPKDQAYPPLTPLELGLEPRFSLERAVATATLDHSTSPPTAFQLTDLDLPIPLALSNAREAGKEEPSVGRVAEPDLQRETKASADAPARAPFTLGADEKRADDTTTIHLVPSRPPSVGPGLDASRASRQADGKDLDPSEVGSGGGVEYVYFSNGYVLAGLAYLAWLVVLVANGYALVSLAMGTATE